MQTQTTGMQTQDFQDFSELATDMIAALTMQPALVDVSVSEDQSEGDTGVIHVALRAPRSEIAMVVGRGAKTAESLHRILKCIARNFGSESDVKLTWEPTDA